MERNHQNEIKKLQQQLNQAKGIEASEENANPMFGALQMKKNPLSNQNPNGVSPRSPANQNKSQASYGYNGNYNKSQQQPQQQNQWNPPQTRIPNGSQSFGSYNPVPGPIAPQRQQRPYNGQQQHGYHAKR